MPSQFGSSLLNINLARVAYYVPMLETQELNLANTIYSNFTLMFGGALVDALENNLEFLIILHIIELFKPAVTISEPNVPLIFSSL
jgi:hypothetical protein